MHAADFEDGVYFGMDEDTYHAIPRLSCSGIKTLMVSPLQFWLESWMNERRKPDTDTPAKKLGRAYHKLILEGEEAFEAAYAVSPSKDDYPDALDGADALKAKCDELGLKKSGRVCDLCERIREADPAVQLWPDLMEEFRATAEGREILTKAQWEEIEQVRYVLRHMPDIKGAFSGGFPEVTFLWTEGAVKMKGRVDYLKPRGNLAAILDLKSFGNVMGKPVEGAPEEEIGRNGYFVQPVAYAAARAAVAAMWREHGADVVHIMSGPEPTQEWLSAVFNAQKCQFHFVFVQTGGIPNVIPCEFAEGNSYGGMSWQTNEYWRKGLAVYRNGMERFRNCMEQYGSETPWIINYAIRRLKDEDFKPWTLEYTTDIPLDEVA